MTPLRGKAGRPPEHGASAGGKRTRTYTTWQSMVARCTNPAHPRWGYYGGRGITVCDEWRSFAAFRESMGERPDGLTIERIDNMRGYEPGNCRWASMKEQAANRREQRLDPTTLKAKCLAAGMPYHVVYWRLRKGWDWARAISKPLRPQMSAAHLDRLGEQARTERMAPVPPFTPSVHPSL
jgi:hypothetical protein